MRSNIRVQHLKGVALECVPHRTGKKTGNALQMVPYELIAHRDEDSCEIVWF